MGVAARDGAVWGTYLHGVFDADAFRRWFIDRLRVRRGLAPVGRDRRASTTSSRPSTGWPTWCARASTSMDEIYRLMGLAMRLEYQILAAVALDLVLGDPALAAAPRARRSGALAARLETLDARG